MLETLLITACIYGTEASCTTSAQAYYKQSKLEQYVTNFQEELEDDMGYSYKIFSYSTIYMIANNQKHAIFPLFRGLEAECGWIVGNENAILRWKGSF